MPLSDHLEKLNHFQRLTAYRSINEGAAAMGISQAGLSKSIASLEFALDTKLFNRTQGGLILTKEGQLVLEAAKEIFKKSEETELTLRAMRIASTPKKIVIGMYDSIAVYFYCELESYLRVIYPNVQMSLKVDTSLNLLKQLADGQLDLAIGVSLDSAKSAATEFFLLFEDHYSFYVSTKVVDEYLKLPLIVYPNATDLAGISVQNYLRDLIQQRGAHEVLNFETLKTLTHQGLGIGVLPTQVAKPLVSLGQLSQVTLPKIKHMFGPHRIGFLATARLLKKHRHFAEDLYRLGERWSKK